MATAFADEVARTRRVGNLSETLLSRALGVSRSTVGAWLRRERNPTGVRADRVAELSAVVERLADVVEPDYIAVWLSKPIEALDFEKPADLIARGDYRRVAQLISELEVGSHT